MKFEERNYTKIKNICKPDLKYTYAKKSLSRKNVSCHKDKWNKININDIKEFCKTLVKLFSTKIINDISDDDLEYTNGVLVDHIYNVKDDESRYSIKIWQNDMLSATYNYNNGDKNGKLEIFEKGVE